MPDRAEEVAHLLQADERIAEARGRLQLMERLIREAQDVGVPPRALVLSSLDTMNGTHPRDAPAPGVDRANDRGDRCGAAAIDKSREGSARGSGHQAVQLGTLGWVVRSDSGQRTDHLDGAARRHRDGGRAEVVDLSEPQDSGAVPALEDQPVRRGVCRNFVAHGRHGKAQKSQGSPPQAHTVSHTARPHGACHSAMTAVRLSSPKAKTRLVAEADIWDKALRTLQRRGNTWTATLRKLERSWPPALAVRSNCT